MANYLASFVAAAALCSTACTAADTPPAAKPAAKPAAAAASSPASTPASAAAHYSRYGTGGSLKFTFMQAGAANTGWFPQFSVDLNYDEKDPAAGRLEVTVQVGSLETKDQERNDTLKSADLLDTGKYPTAHYAATSFARGAGGKLEAVGRLTLHGVTRDLRLPLQIQPNASGITLSGEVAIRRLDYGVGQGDWKSTDTVGDEVKLQFQVPLVRAG